MQNKGAIRLFAIALALVSLYQLSFTLVSNNVKQDAEEYANGDLQKEQAYLDSMANEGVYNFFGIKNYTFNEVQQREINLGLDLKGGMNVILQVDVADVIKSLANNSNDSTFRRALQIAKKRRKSSQEDFITLFGEAFNEVDPNGRLVTIFRTRDMQDRISNDATNEEVLNVIEEEANAAIDNAFNVLRTRINQFGVVQPKIQKLETKGRILVELPGVNDPERVRTLLQRSAKLEFWVTYDNQDIFPYLRRANDILKEREAAKDELEETSADSTSVSDAQTAEQSETARQDTSEGETDELLDEIEGDTSGGQQSQDQLSMEQFKEKNPLFGLLRPATTRQGELREGAVVGYAHYKDTAKVNDLLADPEISALFPNDVYFRWTVKAMNPDGEATYHQLVALRSSGRGAQPALTGDVVVNARSDFGQNQAQAQVSMSMNSRGAEKWARITKENVGNQVAIVLDGKVYSFPVVNQEITGGQSQISGQFSIKEAKDLANVLKAGKLPAPARIIQESVVGPSLGEEAISAGLRSFLIAFIVVMLYMVFYYHRAGWVANVALIANIFFIFGILASLGAVLTLPGLAGIVLTIGISVDANVLIYDRIREELRQGKGIKLAISDGYKNAYSAIIDANLTTLITAIILGYFGKGPIQGFATTLGIGILTSLFSAILITRLIFESLLIRKKAITFATKLTKGAFENLNINFLGKRKALYIVSGLIVAVSLLSLMTKGLNYSVDFKGGRTYIVRFDEKVSTEDIRAQLAESFNHEPTVKTFGQENQVKIVTDYLIEQEGEDVDEEVEAALYQGLKPLIDKDVDEETFLEDYRLRSQKVGPTIADDIKVAAVWALLLSLIFIFLYIFGRFRDWRYGLGAVTAVIHDSLIVLGLFSILYGIVPFSLEIDQAFIAAILTVLGYSINDTVVVYDRIREFFNIHKKHTRYNLINRALNSTISRTFSTSLSTFVVLLTIFLFGGLVIKGFVFAILIGVVVGTYSSLFVAAPITYDVASKVEQVQTKKGKTPQPKAKQQEVASNTSESKTNKPSIEEKDESAGEVKEEKSEEEEESTEDTNSDKQENQQGTSPKAQRKKAQKSKKKKKKKRK